MCEYALLTETIRLKFVDTEFYYVIFVFPYSISIYRVISYSVQTLKAFLYPQTIKYIANTPCLFNQ